MIDFLTCVGKFLCFPQRDSNPCIMLAPPAMCPVNEYIQMLHYIRIVVNHCVCLNKGFNVGPLIRMTVFSKSSGKRINKSFCKFVSETIFQFLFDIVVLYCCNFLLRNTQSFLIKKKKERRSRCLFDTFSISILNLILNLNDLENI